MNAQTNTGRKLGIFLWFGYPIPTPERARLIKEAGFETVLHWWDDSFMEADGFSKEMQVDILRKAGLSIENAHLQVRSVNDLWLDTQDGQMALEGYLADIDGLAKCEISTAVLHPARGIAPPPVSAIGMNRIRTLIERAEKRNVRIAMENVRHPQMLVKILDAIDAPMLGFCYDAGHDFIWSKTPYALLRRYKDRLFAVHLHDNLGHGDDHLPPGAGKVNWRAVRRGIEDSVYRGSLALEGDCPEIPPSRMPEEHLKMYYEGAKRALSPGFHLG